MTWLLRHRRFGPAGRVQEQAASEDCKHTVVKLILIKVSHQPQPKSQSRLYQTAGNIVQTDRQHTSSYELHKSFIIQIMIKHSRPISSAL